MSDPSSLDELNRIESPVPVHDQSVVEQLGEVIELLAQARAQPSRETASLDVVGLAQSESLGRLESRLILLSDILEDFATKPLPPPVVHVDAPTALPQELTMALRQLFAKLEQPVEAGLDEKTIKAMMDLARPRSHSSGSSRTEVQLRNSGGSVIDPATEGTLSSGFTGNNARLDDIKRGITDYRVLFDYDVRTDSNPVYVGKNDQSAGTGDADWTIQQFTYDSSARPTDIQVLTGIWDDRASLGWT